MQLKDQNQQFDEILYMQYKEILSLKLNNIRIKLK
jgi:hypothetical protein